jgi:hypothetical protein
MEWAQVLVIILSVFLALFLLLGIVLLAALIRITRQIKSVTSSAERTASHVERIVAGMSHITSPMMLFGLIKKMIRKRRDHGKR